ncbi:hypothetical protein VFPPC_15143 [Pochonia chlamydosporia 170]|uniref:Uncharacterized protein n=1 Tax=Pochonia chlamydosporia 170 TaxID=1380566 RepID=A0A179G5N0_METCM|nr:hypothetical protein VFPPC_15143 [Pochonia chlamydosporia 170]OAQ72479.1 hypothetical protein VFPPC_15143 [Pochonia chlamydosporia 170]
MDSPFFPLVPSTLACPTSFPLPVPGLPGACQRCRCSHVHLTAVGRERAVTRDVLNWKTRLILAGAGLEASNPLAQQYTTPQDGLRNRLKLTQHIPPFPWAT